MSHKRYQVFLCILSLFPVSVAGCSCNSTSTQPGDPSKGVVPEPALGGEPGQNHSNQQAVQGWYDLAVNKTADKLKREEAIQQLAKAGQSGLAALEKLLSATDRDTVVPMKEMRFGISVTDGYVRYNAIQAIGNVGSSAKSLAPKLANMMLKDESVTVRTAAATNLGKLGSKDPVVISALKDVLKSKDEMVWEGAAGSLDQLWTNDKEAVKLLTDIGNIKYDARLSLEVLKASQQARVTLRNHGY